MKEKQLTNELLRMEETLKYIFIEQLELPPRIYNCLILYTSLVRPFELPMNRNDQELAIDTIRNRRIQKYNDNKYIHLKGDRTEQKVVGYREIGG